MMTMRVPSKTQFEAAATTDKGSVRAFNEDSFLIDEALGLFIVADGMGGHEHGRTASKMACKLIQQQVQQGAKVDSAIEYAHTKIKCLARGIAIKRGMGTTVVVAHITNNRCVDIWWLGDSRAYTYSKDSIALLTHDHSKVQELIDNKIISPNQAKQHPQRNLITGAVGMSGKTDLKIGKVSTNVSDNSALLLCTDGLTNELGEDEICRCLNPHLSPKQHTNSLVKCANQKEGSDNITALIIQFNSITK